MTNARLHHLIERAARDRGIPADLSQEIVNLAWNRLKSTDEDPRPLRRDIVQAVDEVQREWSGRLWSALETLNV